MKKNYIPFEKQLNEYENAWIYKEVDLSCILIDEKAVVPYGDTLNKISESIVSMVLHTLEKTTGEKIYFQLITALHNRDDSTIVFDLVNTCACALLEESEKHLFTAGDMEKPYITKKLTKKILIDNDKPEFEEVAVTPVQVCFRAVRNAIKAEKHVVFNPKSGYLYFSELLHDDDTGEAETIYRRAPKFVDLGSYATDMNGKQIAYTADNTTYADYLDLVEKMQLSPVQYEILKYRMRVDPDTGKQYGKHAISRKLKISESTYKTQLARIRKKAEKVIDCEKYIAK